MNHIFDAKEKLNSIQNFPFPLINHYHFIIDMWPFRCKVPIISLFEFERLSRREKDIGRLFVRNLVTFIDPVSS
ncbi:hypothetical protein PRUPE_5G031900 [Prunus persica]|uniref:Uncharacterized protein n=1 Tax=Prunus persica TaxID=3760 RepID=A0A251P314_PRUPE|nr:hypothetical protein PRUPE_5G031900 [Prunus persica]